MGIELQEVKVKVCEHHFRVQLVLDGVMVQELD